jgi:tetratricopeptide (TPR) repeat protein
MAYSTSDLMRVAERAQVSYIVSGSVSKLSDMFGLNAVMYRLQDWKLKGSRRLEGRGLQSIYGLVKALTPWLKETLDLSQKDIAGDIDVDVGKATTRSLEALRLYQKGMDFFFKRQFQESNESLASAVAEDPEFALAYWKMALNYDYLGKPADFRKNLAKARSLALDNRVSPRERHLILGSYAAFFNESPQEALAIYQKLLREYPDDKEGLIGLGSLYRNNEEWDLAEEYFLKVQKIDKYNRLAYVNQASILMARGQYDAARQVLTANREAFALAEDLFHYFLSLSFLYQGVYSQALTEIEQAILRNPNDPSFWIAKGVIHQLQGDFQGARQVYTRVQEEPDLGSRLTAKFFLAHLALLQGQFRQSRSEAVSGILEARESGYQSSESLFRDLALYMDLRAGRMAEAEKEEQQALELAQELKDEGFIKHALYYSGLIQVKLNRGPQALKTAGSLKDLIDRSGNRKYLHYYHDLMGMIFLNKGSYLQAADSCKAALGGLNAQHSLYDEHAFFQESLAGVYQAAGLMDNAQLYREEISRLTTGRLRFGDIFVLNFYQLGKIYEKKGLVSRAQEAYKKFLSLWNDADRGLPQVEDARQRLSQLGPAL